MKNQQKNQHTSMNKQEQEHFKAFVFSCIIKAQADLGRRVATPLRCCCIFLHLHYDKKVLIRNHDNY